MHQVNRIQSQILFLIALSFVSASVDGFADSRKVWVFFRDRGGQSLGKVSDRAQSVRLGISEKALRNRVKTRGKDRLFDATDLPLESAYVTALQGAGFNVISRSKWLNAVTVLADDFHQTELTGLPFVREVRPVVSFRGRLPESGKTRPPRIGKQVSGTYDYGTSETQVALIHVPEVHELGLTGRGVRIGMLDAGFDPDNRRAFRNSDIIAIRSFIAPDLLSTESRSDTAVQNSHGTETFSVIGGFDEGELIGPAFGSSFALAETEWVSSETRIEEDWWVSGLEWLVDSIGVDVVTSSLAYNTFDDGTGYAYADMDGRTCITTVAANLAADRGVVVCNSAGNEAGTAWRGVLSPSDGEGVLAVGAVSMEGSHAGFSLGGLTVDGRIKPDVSAMGVGVTMVNPNRRDASQYLFASGTSFSCPLTAGVCALVLEAHPDLRPEEVREALRMTASQAGTPDTLLGWGIVNAYEAIYYHGMIFFNFSAVQYTQENRIGFQFEILSRNGFLADSVFVDYQTGSSGTGRVIAARLPSQSKNLYEARFPENVGYRDISFYILARDSAGGLQRSPRQAPEQLHHLADWLNPQPHDHDSASDIFTLHPNYPNPFRESTWIELEMHQASAVDIEVFDCIGRRIHRIHSNPLSKGRVRFGWDARSQSGGAVPSGLYLIRASAGDQAQIIKIIYIK